MLLLDQPTDTDIETHVPRARGGRVTRTCPRCEDTSISRSRARTWLGGVARTTLGIRAYRCMNCWHRFMGISSRA